MPGTGFGFVAKATIQVGPAVTGVTKINNKPLKDNGIDQGLFPAAGGKAKAARAVEDIEGVRGRLPPPLRTADLKVALQSNQDQAVTPQFLGLRARLDFWRQIGADRVLLQAIRVGVQASLCAIPPPQDRPVKVADLPVLQVV